jgi:predicted alpha-1,2-mannosidase
MVETSTEPRLKAPAWAQFDWALLDRYGWLPFDKVDGESVSKTLEPASATTPRPASRRPLGRTDLARAFGERAKSYRQLFDPETRLMRGRDSQGRWRTPFDPLAVTSSPMRNPGDYTEANAWQSTLTPALHDPLGMAELLGGRTALGDWLDRFFELEGPRGDPLPGQEGRLGQYAHSNEPGHHASWLYAWTDRPWQGTLRRRQITRSFYSTRPDGLPGNDDSGQLSAWLVFATMGLYPVVPSSARWALGAPLVRLIRIERPGRPALEIHAPNLVEETPHAAMISIDGKRLAQPEIDHATLLKAGVIEFGMTAPPVANR